MRVRPPLREAISGINKGNTLDSFPTQERIVSDERGNVTSADTILDGSVHDVGEVGDTVLKDVVSDLHDTRAVLQNGNLGALVHLKRTIEKTVERHTGIAIDDENNLTHADVTLSPSLTVICNKHVLERLIVETIVVFSSQLLVVAVAATAFELSQTMELVFDAVREGKTVVHVTGLLELALADEAELVGASLGTELMVGQVLVFSILLGGALEPGEEATTLGSLHIWHARTVADAVLTVVLLASGGQLWLDALHAVIVDEDGRGATLVLIVFDRGHDGDHSGNDDTANESQPLLPHQEIVWKKLPSEAFLVHRHLDGDVRQLIVAVPLAIGLHSCCNPRQHQDQKLSVELIHIPEWNLEFRRHTPAGSSS